MSKNFGSADWHNGIFNDSAFVPSEFDKLGTVSEYLLLSKYPRRTDKLDEENLKGEDVIYDTQSNYLLWNGDGHIITIAPTRSGKGVGIVIPNLLHYSGSVIVFDPKGENYRATHEYRRETLKQKIVRLDPFGCIEENTETDCIRLNVLSDLVGDADSKMTQISKIAEAIVVKPQTEKDPYWNEKSQSFIKNVLTLLVFDREIFLLYLNIYKLIDSTKYENTDIIDLSLLRAFLLIPAANFFESVKTFGEKSSHLEVRRACSEILSMGNNEKMSVMSYALKHTEFLENRNVAEVLSGNKDDEKHFDLNDLNNLNNKTSIYMIIPSHLIAIYSRLIRLWIIKATEVISQRKIGTNNKYQKVLFMLDEMAQLGQMDCLRQAVSLMAGYGMKIWMIWQDLGQLKRLYPEDWSSFIANAKIQQFFGVNDLETATYISNMIGTTTVENVIKNSGSNLGTMSSISKGESIQEGGRQLMMPDEIRRTNNLIMYMFIQGMRPVLTQKIVYHNDGIRRRASKETQNEAPQNKDANRLCF